MPPFFLPMLISISAICLGACAGACLRWLANLALNPLFGPLPMGTLAVNWFGSLLMGLALALFAFYPGLNQQWKLMAVTGFLGSLTTFSAFAGEMASLLQNGRIGLCGLGICLHVIGSIAMVFAGMGIFAGLRRLLP